MGILAVSDTQATFRDVLESDDTRAVLAKPTSNDEGDSSSDGKTDSEVSTPNGDRNPGDENDDDDSLRGVIYIRVSSLEQAEEGVSLENQLAALRELADKLNVTVIDEIKEEGETAQDFERTGFEKVATLAHRGEIDIVLLDDCDRIGRHAAESMYRLWELRRECGVTIATLEEGELDMEEIDDFILTLIRLIAAQLSTKTRTRRANDGKLTKVKQHRNWDSWFGDPPLGYKYEDVDDTESEDIWIEINPGQEEMGRDLFKIFLAIDMNGPYTTTLNKLQAKYGEALPDDFTPEKVKRLLQKPVYIGKPTANYQGKDIPIPDPDLQLIDEDTFDAVQEKIERVRQKYSSPTPNKNKAEMLARTFGWLTTLNASDKVKQHCEECDGTNLVKNKRTSVGEDDAEAYIFACKDCSNQQKFPNEQEYQQMKDS